MTKNSQPARARSSWPFFFFTGTVLLTMTSWLGVSTLAFLRDAEGTQGTVIELQRSASDGSRFAVVEFALASGAKITFHDTTSAKPPLYHVGQRVRVLYRVEDPRQAAIDTDIGHWFWSVVTGFFGTIFVSIGVTGMHRMERLRKRAALRDAARAPKSPAETLEKSA